MEFDARRDAAGDRPASPARCSDGTGAGLRRSGPGRRSAQAGLLAARRADLAGRGRARRRRGRRAARPRSAGARCRSRRWPRWRSACCPWPAGAAATSSGTCWPAWRPAARCSPPRCASRRDPMPAVPRTTADARRVGPSPGRRSACRTPSRRTGCWCRPASPAAAPRSPSSTRRAPGVSVARTPSSGGAPEYTLRLDAAPVADGHAARDAARRRPVPVRRRRRVRASATGLLAGALALTAAHIGTREQFGRPLATFQAVAQQIADVYVASRTLHLATLAACWRLARPDAPARDLDVAAYWLAAEAPAALRTCHHLHGGLGPGHQLPAAPVLGPGPRPRPVLGGAELRLERLGGRVCHRPDRHAARAARRAAGVLRRSALAGRAGGDAAPSGTAPSTARWCAGWAGTAGWASAGRREYGGRGLGPVEQQIFVNEAARADVPLPAVTLQTVGPTLQAHGTPEQKEFFLPRILAGELHFAIGYTEPEAGTDLAALRTRAVRDGDEYVVNGQKTFTTGAHDADYVWLACRTDPAAPRHQGISILIVDTPDPGYSWTPIITCDGAHHVNATYYSGVRVPVGMRVGAENAGLAADHHAAQPRAGDARPGRPAGRALRPGARLGAAAAAGLLDRAGRAADARPDVRLPAGQRAAQLAGGGAPTPVRRRRRLGHQGVRLRADAAARPGARGGRRPARRPGRPGHRRADDRGWTSRPWRTCALRQGDEHKLRDFLRQCGVAQLANALRINRIDMCGDNRAKASSEPVRMYCCNESLMFILNEQSPMVAKGNRIMRARSALRLRRRLQAQLREKCRGIFPAFASNSPRLETLNRWCKALT